MKKVSGSRNDYKTISRRRFFGVGGAVVAGGAFHESILKRSAIGQDVSDNKLSIKGYRILGRTGFKVSDIAMGGTRNENSRVVNYAYESGVNYFDTGESYINGRSENIIGEALKLMDRKKIFITTKIRISDKDTEETVLDRFQKCQERLQTDYIDAFYMHGVTDITLLNHEGFHSAVGKLKADGRLKYIGLSCHGPQGSEGTSMEDVLCAAAEDGRFDLMLLVYSFMNKEAGEKVLKVCKKNNIGTTAMKTAPGVLKVIPFDPENPTEEQARTVKRLKERGLSEERIHERMQRRSVRSKETAEKTKPFVEKYGIKSDEQLWIASIQWVLNNPDMHTVCVSFSSFDQIDKIIPVSGTKLSHVNADFLKEYKRVFNNQYCRHGCNMCVERCPYDLPVSTIMRYAYYFKHQAREKYAMSKYRDMKRWNASHCTTCSAPCINACPHGLDVRAQLLNAHSMLTFA